MRVRVSPERKVIWRARCNLTTARRRQGLSVCVLLSSSQFRLISFFRDARKLHFSVQWSSATADVVVTCYCAWRTSLLISLASDSVVIRLSPPLDAVLPDVMQVPKGRHCSLEFQVTLSKTSLPAHVVVVVVVVVVLASVALLRPVSLSFLHFIIRTITHFFMFFNKFLWRPATLDAKLFFSSPRRS